MISAMLLNCTINQHVQEEDEDEDEDDDEEQPSVIGWISTMLKGSAKKRRKIG